MIQKFISGVSHLRQDDNKITPTVACYPTSMAILMLNCLDYIGADKKIIGCPYDMQLEDFINEHTMSKDTKNWIRKNVSVFGDWMLQHRPRTIAVVEEMVFNKLMAPLGFTVKFKVNNVDIFLDEFTKQKFPVVLHGDFRSVSSVEGHICAMEGYVDPERWIIKDPFGNALTGYKNKDGSSVIYPRKFFLKKKNKLSLKKTMVWYQMIERMPV